MTSTLLLVEVSTSMRSVIGKFVETLGFDVRAVGTFDAAEEALLAQFRHFDTDYAAVLFGWPSVPDERANAFIARLESADFADLPVIVLSTDMRAETRAWVAGRHNTAVIAWKDYRRVAAMLPRLLDIPAENLQANGDVFDVKFDNRDISLLIVDDSRSIRCALKDLFTLHGYEVELAGTHEEALRHAQHHRYDIAIIDFYLKGGTGDALCRELIADPDTGDITCTVLTGTYADHIIKRSLRAGAVECMFKSESSELLLARIDAISRFIRQRTRQVTEQRRLDTVIDTVAGGALLLDRNAHIRYASPAALAHLGYDSLASLHNARAAHPVNTSHLRVHAGRPEVVALPSADGKLLSVPCRLIPLEDAEALLVIAGPSDRLTPGRTALVKLGMRLKWRASATAVLEGCVEASRLSGDGRRRHLVLLDCAVQPADMASTILDPEAAFTALILDDVFRSQAVVTRLACTAAGRFALVLSAATDAEAYRALRSIMLAVNVLSDGDTLTEVSTAAVVSTLSGVPETGLPALLLRTQGALELFSARQRNMALLLDHKRLLPVYSEQQGQ